MLITFNIFNTTAILVLVDLLCAYYGEGFFMFSDGFVDQYGGEKGKKFKIRRFRELLLSLQTYPMEQQKKMMEEHFEQWRGSLDQIDDLCVVGVRV